MSPVEILDLLVKLGPLAREHGIESVQVGDVSVKFHRAPQMTAVAISSAKKPEGEPEKPRPTFAGRTPEDIRNAIPNWGNE